MLSLRRCILFIDRGHWLMLLVAAPLMLFPAPARTPLLLVVPVVWVIGWIARPRAPLPSTPLNAVLLVLMVMVLVSVVVTPDLAFSLPKVAGMVLAIGAYFAVAREASKPVGLWLCVLALLGVGAGVAVLAAARQGKKRGHRNRSGSACAPDARPQQQPRNGKRRAHRCSCAPARPRPASQGRDRA